MNLPEGYNLRNGKYQLTKVIGQGGFGITYLGFWNTEVKGELGTVKTEVPVCVKEYFFKDYCYRDENSAQVLVHSETGKQLFDKFKEKLIKEAKILSDVHHPYIVNVLEVFEENHTAYIAMEHIAGCSLKYMLDVEGIMSEKKVLRYISQIAQALDFVHQKNILHLDIKPSNILIDKKNNARLIDFGVSKRYDIEQQETSTTMLTLSKGFAPIEQYDNEGTQNFSPCPDIYSLGATMYNLLTGEVPVESILRATKPLVKPSEINKDISPQTETTILTAMQVNPIHRYQSVKAMLNDLNIPSYFEETPNLLVENIDFHPKVDKEETEIRSDSKPSQPIDEEQTTIRQTETSSQSVHTKKSKRRIWMLFLIFGIAFLGYGVAYLLELNGSGGDEQPVTNVEKTDDGFTFPATEDKPDTQEPMSSTGNTTNTRPVETAVPETNTRPVPENQSPVVDVNENVPSPEVIDAEYNSLMESGRAKMSQKNYTEATADFEQAQKLKPTMEVERLIEECTIETRKAQYKEVMPVGNLKIVQKRSDNKWGAIDNQGIERIPCNYLRASLTSNNRIAFERNDHLYDIYDANGDIKDSAASDY